MYCDFKFQVAQVAAKTLGVPIEMIQIKSTDNFSGANSFASGGSMASDMNAYVRISNVFFLSFISFYSKGVKICCERLRERINNVAREVKKEGVKKLHWSELIQLCFTKNVDLSERYQYFQSFTI